MSLPKELQSESGAKYRIGDAYQYSGPERESLRQLLITPDIYVNRTDVFGIKHPDIGYNYVLPSVSSVDVVNRWYDEPMRFWQNQLNFAVWCATTGCGVSVKDYLLSHYDFAPDNLLQSLSIFRFHVYYQTRKILKRMKCALPYNASWSAFDNPIDMAEYQLVYNEFDVAPGSDWRQKKSGNNGLGRMRQLSSGTAIDDYDLDGQTFDPNRPAGSLGNRTRGQEFPVVFGPCELYPPTLPPDGKCPVQLRFELQGNCTLMCEIVPAPGSIELSDAPLGCLLRRNVRLLPAFREF